MYLILSYTYGSQDHFYPLDKGWVSGANILLATLAQIINVGSVEDENQQK